MPELVILIPVLGRPQNAAPVAYSAHKATPDATVLFIYDVDDDDEVEAVRDTVDYASGWCQCFGMAPGSTYSEKINAGIGLARTGYSPFFYFSGADDLDFQRGWYEAAKEKMTDTVGVVGTNDFANPKTIRGDHSTHFLIADWYARLGGIDGRPGIFHEGYRHMFVDNEVIAVARMRGAYDHAGDAVVRHHHPIFDQDVAFDSTYRIGMDAFDKDKARFKAREHMWK